MNNIGLFGLDYVVILLRISLPGIYNQNTVSKNVYFQI